MARTPRTSADDCVQRYVRFSEDGHFARRPLMIQARNGPYVTLAAYQQLARESVAVVRSLLGELERLRW